MCIQCGFCHWISLRFWSNSQSTPIAREPHSSKFSALLVLQERSQGPASEGTPTGPNQQLRAYLQVGSTESPKFLIRRFSGSYRKLHINRHCVILRNWSVSPNKSRSVLIVVAQFLSSTILSRPDLTTSALQSNQVFWYLFAAFLRPARYAEGTLFKFDGQARDNLCVSHRYVQRRILQRITIHSDSVRSNKSRFSRTLPAHNIV